MNTPPSCAIVYVRYYSSPSNVYYKRIAYLPDPTEELINLLRSIYKEPKYSISVSNFYDLF